MPLLGSSGLKLPCSGVADSFRTVGLFFELSLGLAAHYKPCLAVLKIS